jgi:uncharacterized protein YkwD
MKTINIWLFFLLLVVNGCSNATSTNHSGSSNNLDDPSSYKAKDVNITNELNSLREKSDLNRLSVNNLLNSSSLNHSNYLVTNNISSHYEDSTKNGFTGYAPVDRTMYVNYKSRRVSENLSTGQATELLSLDGLMSAIYHRFGFLSLSIDEIGYGKKDKTYVYNMGNSNINTLCAKNNFTNNGRYYTNVCKDKDFKIEKSIYDNAIDTIINSNPAYVIYPYRNQKNVTPVFFEESPDPLPGYSVSGYPISIEFSSKDEFVLNKLVVKSFIIKDNNQVSLDLISHGGSTIMKKDSDPNSKFSDLQFAIFPDKRLDYGKIYSVEFSYLYDDEIKNINWEFTTKNLDNLLTYLNADIANKDIGLDKNYYLYFEPENITDVISSYSTNCSYASGGNVQIESSLYDKNTIKIKISGSLVQSCDLTINSSKTVKLNIN